MLFYYEQKRSSRVTAKRSDANLFSRHSWHKTQVECLKATKRAEKCFSLIWKRMIKSFQLLKLISSNRLNRRRGISAAEKVGGGGREKRNYFMSIWQLIKIATFLVQPNVYVSQGRGEGIQQKSPITFSFSMPL